MLAGRWRHTFVRVRGFMPLAFEMMLTLLTARGGWLLLSDPDFFDRAIQAQAYRWLTVHVSDQEWQFGLLAALAAACMAVGFALFATRRRRWNTLAFALRETGLCAAFVFWTCIGASVWEGNPGTLPGGNTLALGVLALGMMVAGPVEADGPNGI